MLLKQFLSMKLPFQWCVVGKLQIRPIEKYTEIWRQYDNVDKKYSLFTTKGGAVFVSIVNAYTIPLKILDNSL